ncbi:MAG: fibronectin type III domain-containing protein [Acidobacteria bacterium]|nr:fibronectin type III domain-containing protein [Acidobacteriota bacterium]
MRQFRVLGFTTSLVAVVTTLMLGVAPTSSALAATPTSAWRVADGPHTNASWYAATYGAGRFVVVGHGASSSTSNNGVTWRTNPAPGGSWQSLAYGAGKFVALSALNAPLREMISSDGVHWSALPGPAGEWTGLTYGAGRFLAVSALGQLDTSLDGVHWSTTWTRSQFLLNSVAYGNGRFVAVDAADGDALISLDGVHWSFYPITTASTPWFAVTYGNGVFSAFSPHGLAATSTLGYTWVTHPDSTVQQMNAAAFGCNTFVATGQAQGGVNNVITSHLGSSWSATPVPADASANWTALAYGNGDFVAVNTAGTIATMRVPGYCGATVATPPRDVSGNVENGQVWTYQHPPNNQGGAPIDGYLVTISSGRHQWTCHAAVYYEPNCIIRGLANHRIYTVTTQVHNRFGYSAPSDPEWVIPVSHWSLQVFSPATVTSSSPLTVQITGVVANAAGIYPQSPLTLHFGARQYDCVPSPFGECVITVTNPPTGRTAMWASYTGYGVSYRSPTTVVTVAAAR